MVKYWMNRTGKIRVLRTHKYDARGIVGLQRNEKLLVAGDMNGHVGKDRAEYEDYMEVMESEE